MMNDLEKKYFNEFTKPSSWIDVAELHFFSASLIDKQIKKLINTEDILTDGYGFEFASYRGSCLLLIGLSLENAIKGQIIFNFKEEIEKIPPEERTLKYIKDELIKGIEKQYKWSRGHIITEMYKVNLPDIYSIYKLFLERTQENLIWMGKYSLPNPKREYFSNMENSKDYWEDDISNAKSIINKIKININY